MLSLSQSSQLLAGFREFVHIGGEASLPLADPCEFLFHPF